MFLDSDDVYERHGCKNLLLAAERTRADVVAGRVVRVNLTKDKESLWAKDLFAARAVYHGVRDNPMIFFDPLSTNKIYRREFLDRHGIRFPEGVHYEDSLFSTKVYCLAETIAIIPNLVYLWRVVEDAEERSITQRRYEFENFRDRVAVHRMMDTFLREHDGADLKVYKDFKFVRHDLKLYLTDLAHRDEEYQHKFMRLAADYCATISDETLAMVYPLERICVHLIRRLDVGRDAAHGRLPALRLQAVDRPGRARRQGLLDGEVPRHTRGPRGHGRHRDGLPPAAVQPDQPPQPGDLRAGGREPSCTSRARWSTSCGGSADAEARSLSVRAPGPVRAPDPPVRDWTFTGTS